MRKAFSGLFTKALSNRECLFGVFFGLLTLVVLCVTLFGAPRYGAIDYGEYYDLLRRIGLEHTSATLRAEPSHYYTYVVETFEYVHFSYMRLLTPSGLPSIAYPAALIRLFTQPFGLSFSTAYLAGLLAVLTAIAVYLITRYGYRFIKGAVCFPVSLLLLILSDINFTGYYNSLYPTATAFVSLLFFGGYMLRAAALRRKGRLRLIVPVILSGMLFCAATAEYVVFLPMVILSSLALTWALRPERIGQLGYFALAATLLIGGSASAWRVLQTNYEVVSNVADYHAVFSGIFKYSPDPSADMEAFDLDASWLPDTGKTYYEPAESYAHNPDDPAVQAFLTERINPARRLLFFLHHPGRMSGMLQGAAPYMRGYASERMAAVYPDDDGQYARTGILAPADALHGLLPSLQGMLLILCAIGLLALAAALWPRKKGFSFAPLAGIVLFGLCLGVVLLLPFRLFLTGDISIDRIKVYYLFLRDVTVLTTVGCAIYFINTLLRPHDARTQAPKAPADAPQGAMTLRLAFRFIARSRRRTAAFVLSAALLLSLWLLFVPPRSGTVNNGDYGRVMDQLGLTWLPYYRENYDLNAMHEVIEVYNYAMDMQWEWLTTLRPTYSLVYPAALVRLYCDWTGQPFHTNYMSYVFVLAALLCLYRIVCDLYSLYGRMTLPIGLLLAMMLFGEIYLVWFNSLFGEGTIYLGLLMMLSCSLRLIVLPRRKGFVWLLLLAFSCRFLLASKSQMLLALPGCLLLMAAFSIYHMPLRWISRIPYFALTIVLCALFAYNAYTVYEGNAEINEKSTLWQSIFYGLLMVSDDPVADMEAMGIDTAMAPDIGKHAYEAYDSYVYAPQSEEAVPAFYDHVSVSAVVKYYLRHPLKLYTMLQFTADESQWLHNDFMLYVGETFTEGRTQVDRFGFWQYLRTMFSSTNFLFYVAFYSAALFWCISRLVRRGVDIRAKLYTLTLLAFMVIGVVQYPLTAVGNGFADTNKQLFAFMLCHDLLVILLGFTACITLRARWARHVLKKGEESL